MNNKKSHYYGEAEAGREQGAALGEEAVNGDDNVELD